MQSIFDSGTSCKFMPYGQLFAPQIGPAQGAEFAKQHSSAMRCVPRTDAVVLAAVPRRDIKSETRSVSYLISLREGMDKSFFADGQECPSLLVPKGGVFRYSPLAAMKAFISASKLRT